jgi:diguanylate cyclase (GGDEF)-like protein/PAS domain S-box-containing protein
MDWHFEEILERIDGYVYLLDVATYRVLYVNGSLKRALGEEVVGRSCFEVFQGRSAPCEFCPNERVFASSKKAFSFEIYNPKLRRHFYCMDFALESPENVPRKLEIAIDITKARSMRVALESLVRLFLSLDHNYFTNVEKILRFILKQWEGDEVAYRGRGGQLFTVQKDTQMTLSREAWTNIFDAALQKRRWRLKRKDGRILVLQVDRNAFLGIWKRAAQKLLIPRGTYFVISRLLYLEEERQREAWRWFRLFDRSPDLLFLVTGDGKIVESNARVSEVLGWSKNILQNDSVELIFGKGIWQKLLERMGETALFAMEIEVQNVRGELLNFEARLSLFDENDTKFYLLSLRDIGERKRYESVLLRFALYDQLTGLYNRRFLEEYLSKELERCKREGYPLSVAFVDVNSFKKINDVYGHVFGDEVLKAVAETMQNMVRASDVVARYGGDEFVLVLPRANEEEALRVMERIARNLRAGQIGGEPFSVRISYGVYTWDRQKTIAELFQEIDRRMYRMKKEGELI